MRRIGACYDPCILHSFCSPHRVTFHLFVVGFFALSSSDGFSTLPVIVWGKTVLGTTPQLMKSEVLLQVHLVGISELARGPSIPLRAVPPSMHLHRMSPPLRSAACPPEAASDSHCDCIPAPRSSWAPAASERPWDGRGRYARQQCFLPLFFVLRHLLRDSRRDRAGIVGNCILSSCR